MFPLLNLLTPVGLVLSLKLVMPRTLAQIHGVAALHLSSTMVLVGIPPMLFALVSTTMAWIGAVVAVIYLALATWKTLAGLQRAGVDSTPRRAFAMTFARWVAVLVAYLVIGNAISLATMALAFATA